MTPELCECCNVEEAVAYTDDDVHLCWFCYQAVPIETAPAPLRLVPPAPSPKEPHP